MGFIRGAVQKNLRFLEAVFRIRIRIWPNEKDPAGSETLRSGHVTFVGKKCLECSETQENAKKFAETFKKCLVIS